MKLAMLYICLLCVGLFTPGLSAGAEFYEEQILPTISWIFFSKKHVGLISEKHRNFDLQQFYMVYYRSGRTFEEVTVQQFSRLFPKKDRYKNPSKEIRECFTSDGMHIVPEQRPDCRASEDKKPFSLITVNGQPANVPVNSCSTISSVEAVGDQLWFGTYYVGDDAIWQKDGLVVVQRNTFKRVKQLDVNHIDAPIYYMRLDPFDKTVWVATEGGLYLIDASINIQAKYHFYHTFDQYRNMPELTVWHDKRKNPWEEKKKSNPLAVIARLLPLEDQHAFVQETKKVPESLAMQFNLSNFFMCCNYKYKKYPAGFKFMVPYIYRAGLSRPKGERNLWHQAMCQIDAPQAEIYCREREISW